MLSFGSSSSFSAVPAASSSFAISPPLVVFFSWLSPPQSPSSLTPKSFRVGKTTHLSLFLPLVSCPDHPHPRAFPASRFFNLLFYEEALICISSDMSMQECVQIRATLPEDQCIILCVMQRSDMVEGLVRDVTGLCYLTLSSLLLFCLLLPSLSAFSPLPRLPDNKSASFKSCLLLSQNQSCRSSGAHKPPCKKYTAVVQLRPPTGSLSIFFSLTPS